MEDLDTPQKRLERFIRVAFGTKTEFANKMGMHRNDLSHYTGKGKSEFITPEKIDNLKKIGLNYEWYMRGDGEMFLDNAMNNSMQNKSNVSNVADDKIIRVYDIDKILDTDNMTPIQANKILTVFNKNVDKLKKLAELAE